MLEKIVQFLPELLKIGLPAIASFFFGEWNARRKWKNDEDARTLKKLMGTLPSFQLIERRFSKKAMTDSFTTDVYHKFYEAFDTAVSDPSMHFIDTELQALVREIETKTKEFLGVIAVETFPTQIASEQSIRRLKYGDHIDDFATGERLNAMSDEIFDKYKSLMAEAKKKRIPIGE